MTAYSVGACYSTSRDLRNQIIWGRCTKYFPSFEIDRVLLVGSPIIRNFFPRSNFVVAGSTIRVRMVSVIHRNWHLWSDNNRLLHRDITAASMYS